MKRCGKRLTLLVALLACAPLAAHAPVVGRPDSDSLFKDRDPKLNANKQAVYHSGRDGVVQLFGNREKKPLPKTMSARSSRCSPTAIIQSPWINSITQFK
jgi:hypothetical protein